MLGLEKDPSEIPMYFADAKETAGLSFASGLDNRPDAPFRSDLVTKTMLKKVGRVPVLDDMFLEAMDRAMTGTIPLSSAPAAPELVDDAPADEGPEGRTCVDAVWQVLAESVGRWSAVRSSSVSATS